MRIVDLGWYKQETQSNNSLDIAFANRTLRTLSTSPNRAAKKFGHVVAEALKGRLADIAAAENVQELPLPIRVQGLPPGQFSIGLVDGFEVIFASNHLHDKATNNAKVHWPKVTRVLMLEVTPLEKLL